MKGIILVNAYTQSQEELYQPQRIYEELTSLGVEVTLCRNNEFLSYVGKEGVFTRANEYDFCVYLDKDKYMPRMLEQAGLRLFNCAEAVETCDDKMLTYLALAGKAPIPKTYAGLLCYTKDVPVASETLNKVEALSYPVVVKECFGAQGKQVYLARNREELAQIASAVQGKPHLFQEFIKSSAGRDLRVIVIGGKAVGGMLRTGEDFRSNVGAGGSAQAIELDKDAKALAERVASLLKLDYCGVDLLFGDEGYLVCEVNSNAFFHAFERVTGINVAKRYAEYIVNAIE